MRRYIDAHVHITPASDLGKDNPRFGTKRMPYGYLQKGDGGFYTMPPYMHDSQFTEDTLIHMMDVYGVEKSIILQSLMSKQNEVVAAAVRKYPDRLAGAMVIEPTEGWEEEMEHWYEEGLHSMKFEMRSFTDAGAYPDIRYTDERMMRLFEKAGNLHMTVTIDPAPVDFPVYEPEGLRQAVNAFPDAHFVLCHMGYPRPIDTDALRARWESMLSVAKAPNCWLDVSAMPDFFDAEGWPYPTALNLIKTARDTVGANKLIWGSDITGTLNRATYPQMMQMFDKADALTEDELDALYYRNAKEAYRL